MDNRDVDQRQPDRVGRWLTLTLAIMIVAMLTINSIASAVQNGSIGWLIGFVVGGILLALLVIDRLSVIHHRLVEANAIKRAVHFERLHDGTFSMSFGEVVNAGEARQIATTIGGTSHTDRALDDPRREDAIALIAATLNHPDYGPRSTRLIPQATAEKGGLYGGTRFDDAVAYLKEHYGVYTETTRGSHNGTFVRDGSTVGQLLLETSVHDLAPAPGHG